MQNIIYWYKAIFEFLNIYQLILLILIIESEDHLWADTWTKHLSIAAIYWQQELYFFL